MNELIRETCKRDQRLWTSFHEAAHVVFALRLEVPFERVVVFDSTRFSTLDEMARDNEDFADAEDAEGGLVYVEDMRNPVASALIGLAGVVFEEWMGNNDLGASRTDLDSAVDAVGQRVVNKPRPSAHTMLITNFESIVRVGEELYCRGRMTEQECREVLNAAAPAVEAQAAQAVSA